MAKTLYGYCPNCKAQVRVDAFAGATTYKPHRKASGKPCQKSGQTCEYVPRDHFAGKAVSRG